MRFQIALVALTFLAFTATARPLSEEDYSFFYPKPEITTVPFGSLLSDRVAVNANETLRDAAARHGLFMGSAASDSVVQQDPVYSSVLNREYSLFTAENACKFSPTEPNLNVFNFTFCNVILKQSIIAKSAFRGHNFIWGSDNPDWLVKVSRTPAELLHILQTHIANVGKQYGDVPVAWDVVNEAVADSGSDVFKPAAPWYPALPDYVDQAFIAARAAVGPHVKLFYNDYGAEGLGQKSEKVYNMIRSMKQRGIPIDGVGLQMHISVDGYPKFADVASNIARLASLGVEVHITEMDVRCTPPCGEDRLRLQASIYGGILSACLQHSACKNFETWGYTDKYTWLWSFENPKHVNMQPLPFDINFAKKLAYTEMLATLQQNHTRV